MIINGLQQIKLVQNLHNPLKITTFVVDDKGKSSYTPLSRGGWGCVNVEPGNTLADKTTNYEEFSFSLEREVYRLG